MVVALTEGQWAGLQQATGTAKVFEALEAALDVDLRREEERYRHRETIAAIVGPWFAARDIGQVSAELDGARALWGRYRGMADVAAAHRRGAHPVLADVELDQSGLDQPGVNQSGTAITARSPLRWNGEYGEPGQPPILGRETEQVLTEVLGLTAPELARLRDRGVIAAPGDEGVSP
jgi:2-methylfumaryl-CoA isomerase